MNMETEVEESCLPGYEDKLDKSYLDYSDTVYTHKLVNSFQELWESGALTDIVLDVKGQEFKVHRVVLAAGSPYFRAMFTGGMKESLQRVVVINAIEPDTMERLLQFLYTGRVRITGANAGELIQAAGLFQLESLMEACASFLQGELDTFNCIGIYLLALMSMYSCQTLTQVARTFILKNFIDVSSSPEFVQLPPEELKQIMDDKRLFFMHADQLTSAVTRWLNHDIESRRSHVKEFLRILERKGIDCDGLCDNNSSENKRQNVYSSQHQTWQSALTISNHNVKNPSQMSNYEVFLCFGNAWARSQVKTKNDAVKCYNPITNKFYTLESEPANVAARDFNTACQVGDKVIVGLRTGKFLSYTPRKGTWEVLSKYLLTPLCGQTMTSVDDVLYICGDSGKFYLYDQETNQLESKEDMISPVKSGCAVTVDGKIYVIGGKVRGDLHAQGTTLMQCYDPRVNHWKVCRAIPEKCTSFTAAELNGLIYVIGTGCREHLRSTKTVLRYNPTTDTWCKIADLNKSRQSSSAVVCNGKLYVTGGFDVSRHSEDIPVSEVECYDTATDEWHVIDEFPIHIAFHQSISLPVSHTKPIHQSNSEE